MRMKVIVTVLTALIPTDTHENLVLLYTCRNCKCNYVSFQRHCYRYKNKTNMNQTGGRP